MTTAHKTYAASAKAGMNTRELEASALLKAAAMLQNAQSGDDELARDNALTHNRRLWAFFAGSVQEEATPLPEALRTNILTLSNFVFNQTVQATTDRSAEILTPLISINRDLAAGLRGQ